MFQDLSTCHDRPLKKAVVVLSIRLKENSKHTSSNSLSLLGPSTRILALPRRRYYIVTGVKLHFYSSINNEEKSAWEKP